MEIIERTEEIKEKVKNTGIFKYIPSEDFEAVERFINIIRFKKGETIISEGEITGGMFMVMKGKVEVIKNNVKIAELEEGEIFGESDILLNRNASATIKSSEDDTQIIYIIRGGIENLEKSNPSFTTIFYKNIAKTALMRLINLDREYVKIMEKFQEMKQKEELSKLREKIFKSKE
jgi:signal-transduction protein with cAMP-binding, CBS, and nucleotidyltransferase domain